MSNEFAEESKKIKFLFEDEAKIAFPISNS